MVVIQNPYAKKNKIPAPHQQQRQGARAPPKQQLQPPLTKKVGLPLQATKAHKPNNTVVSTCSNVRVVKPAVAAAAVVVPRAPVASGGTTTTKATSTVAVSTSAPPTKKRPTNNLSGSTAVPVLSFKARLKQEIQDLKRAKRAKVILKSDQERKQQLELERKQKQVELERERQLKEQERLKKEQERLEKIRLKEQERLEKVQQKEKERLEKLQLKEQERLEKLQRKEEERVKREQARLQKEQERREWLFQVEEERRMRLQQQFQQHQHQQLQQQQHLMHQRPIFYGPFTANMNHNAYNHNLLGMQPQQQHQQLTQHPFPGIVPPRVPPSMAPVLAAQTPNYAGRDDSTLTSPMGAVMTPMDASGRHVTPSPRHPVTDDRNHHQVQSPLAPAIRSQPSDVAIVASPTPQVSSINIMGPAAAISKVTSQCKEHLEAKKANSTTASARTEKVLDQSRQDHPRSILPTTLPAIERMDLPTTGPTSITSNEKIVSSCISPEGSPEENRVSPPKDATAHDNSLLTESDPLAIPPVKTASIESSTQVTSPTRLFSENVAERHTELSSSSSGHCGNVEDKIAPKVPHCNLDMATSAAEAPVNNDSPERTATVILGHQNPTQQDLESLQSKTFTISKDEPVTLPSTQSSSGPMMPSFRHDTKQIGSTSREKGNLILNKQGLMVKENDAKTSSGAATDSEQALCIDTTGANGTSLPKNAEHAPSHDGGSEAIASYSGVALTSPTQLKTTTTTLAPLPANASNQTANWELPKLGHFEHPNANGSNGMDCSDATTTVAKPGTVPVTASCPSSDLQTAQLHKHPMPMTSHTPSFGTIPWAQPQHFPGAVAPWPPGLPAYGGGPAQSMLYQTPRTMYPYPNMMHTAQGGGWHPWAWNPSQPMSHHSTTVPAFYRPNNFGVHPPKPLLNRPLKPMMATPSTVKTARRASQGLGMNIISDKLASALELPSPFSLTHIKLPEPVVIVRKNDENFGVNIRCERRSALVDPDWLEQKAPHHATGIQLQQPQVQKPTIGVGDVKESVTINQPTDPPANTAAHPHSEHAGGVTTKTAMEMESSTEAVPSAAKQKKKRRRRVFFGVLWVVDAIKQNSRRTALDSEKAKLEEGDVILSINGQSVAGLTFQEACGLFKKSSTSDNDSGECASLSATLVIARLKAKLKLEVSPSKTTKLAVPTPKPSLSVKKGEVTNQESAILAGCMVETMTSPHLRLLGQHVSEEALRSSLVTTILANRDFATLQQKWNQLTQALEHRMQEQAETYWKQNWLVENPDIRQRYADLLEGWTDAQRAAIRNMPRPARGCRCGKEDHEYMHDQKCALYSNLLRIAPSEPATASQNDENSKGRKAGEKLETKMNLNSVQAAFKDRIIKLKEATEMEAAEARFVRRMERVQVEQCQQAVFAPSLTTMVLSAVIALRQEFPSVIEAKEEPSMMTGEVSEDDDSDGEEDLPLAALGKRKTLNDTEQESKKQKLQSRPSYAYLTRLLGYISKTWGHVYTEPSHSEYAWRWEVWHGHNSNSQHGSWESHSRNPRVPGSLQFENIQFFCSSNVSDLDSLCNCLAGSLENPKAPTSSNSPVLKSATINAPEVRTEEATNVLVSKEQAESFVSLAHLLSPSRTGLYDEVLALMTQGILSINSSGIPTLSIDWWSRVDILMLEEMFSTWGEDDPDGLYLVHPKLRSDLEENWVRTEVGWALADDPDDVYFDFFELDEWRETFEGKIEAKQNHSEGIGRFGL